MKKYNKIILYSLSSCFWCSKIKKLLKELNVEFEEIYVDLLSDEDSLKVMETLKENETFPVLKLDNDYIIGYKEESVRKLFQN
ncbi:MAG: glutaredoxin family protein [Endomicrobiaceae bacterium]